MTLELTDLTSHQLLLKLDEFKHEAQKAGEKFVELESLSRDLKLKSEAILSEMLKQSIESGKAYNVAKCYASCSDEFKQAQEEWSKSEHEMNLVKIQYDLAKSAIRTLESIGYVRNNELKMLRG